MEPAKVYFTDFRTQAFGDGLPTKLKKLVRRAGIAGLDLDGKFVAVKLHFGELGNVIKLSHQRDRLYPKRLSFCA